MSIAWEMFCFAVTLTIFIDAVLPVATGVGGCRWTIYYRAVLVEVAFWKFSNNPPSSVSVADTMTFLMMLHSTCTGPFYGGISWTRVLKFGPRKNILCICFVPPVLICRMNWSIWGESFQFFCILLLCLDMLRCNLEIESFVLQFQLSALSSPSSGSLGPSTLWDIWLWHNIRVFLLFYEVFSDYIHPIIQLVIFMIAYDYSFYKRVVSRGMVSPVVV